MEAGSNPPAGWYADPQGQGQRYWDGEKWTSNIAPGQPMAGQLQVVGSRTNGMAIASLVLGIIWIYGLGALLALIFGLIAQKQIDESEGMQTGRGMATAGVVLGIVGLAGILFIVLFGVSSFY
ncbi:MAG: DUF4190 domain-containing protein [Solirubrobacterales bacterium]